MEMTVTSAGGKAFAVAVRGHRVLTDQKIEHGGEDKAPTPLEYFIASLSACTAVYAASYLKRHNLPYESLSVDTEWETASAPDRVASVKMTISGAGYLSEKDSEGLLSSAKHCTVKMSLEMPPEIDIRLA